MYWYVDKDTRRSYITELGIVHRSTQRAAVYIAKEDGALYN